MIILIGVIFSNDAMLSMSDKYYSVNELTQEIGELMKLHVQGAWRNARKFIIQTTGSLSVAVVLSKVRRQIVAQ